MTENKNTKDIRNSMRIQSVTSSFSIEGKSPRGTKTSTFLSYTAHCENAEGWTMEEASVAKIILAEKVTRELYVDTIARQQLDPEVAREQIKHVGSVYESLLNAQGTSNTKKNQKEEENIDG